MTYMAFKVLRFLMLYKDFFIIKIPVTIPAPGLQLLLLLTAHDDRTRDLRRKKNNNNKKTIGRPSSPPSRSARSRGRMGKYLPPETESHSKETAAAAGRDGVPGLPLPAACRKPTSRLSWGQGGSPPAAVVTLFMTQGSPGAAEWQ